MNRRWQVVAVVAICSVFYAAGCFAWCAAGLMDAQSATSCHGESPVKTHPDQAPADCNHPRFGPTFVTSLEVFIVPALGALVLPILVAAAEAAAPVAPLQSLRIPCSPVLRL
jgi:hypothetical protein